VREKISNIPIIFILVFIAFLIGLKIYIANQIYFISRDIQKISVKIDALKEEKNILKLKIEKLKYKNTIEDPLFNYEINDNTNGAQIVNEEIENNKEQNQEEEIKTNNPLELFNNLNN
jgi:hypothetical protein